MDMSTSKFTNLSPTLPLAQTYRMFKSDFIKTLNFNIILQKNKISKIHLLYFYFTTEVK